LAEHEIGDGRVDAEECNKDYRYERRKVTETKNRRTVTTSH
jgi:hypothetical protein